MVTFASPAKYSQTGRLNWPLVKSTAVAGLGGLLFGFDTAVIAGVTKTLTNLFHLTRSARLDRGDRTLGTITGAILAGIPGDKYGRRDSLRGLAILFLASALGCAFPGTGSRSWCFAL